MTAGTARASSAADSRWGRYSILPGRVGLTWWAAILLALALTAGGVLIDMQRIGRLGIIFQACYFIGCLLAAAIVQRRALFGPMVQPPLLLAVAVPSVVAAGGAPSSAGGLSATMLAIGTPLINGFPTMAVTTLATIALGVVRLVMQRPPAKPDKGERKEPPSSQRRSKPSRPNENRPPNRPQGPRLSRPREQRGRRDSDVD